MKKTWAGLAALWWAPGAWAAPSHLERLVLEEPSRMVTPSELAITILWMLVLGFAGSALALWGEARRRAAKVYCAWAAVFAVAALALSWAPL